MDCDECSVCYTQTTEKTPCGHVLCLYCFMNMKECPICRKVFEGDYFKPRVEIITVPLETKTETVYVNVPANPKTVYVPTRTRTRNTISDEDLLGEFFEFSGKTIRLKDDVPDFFISYFQNNKLTKTNAKKSLKEYKQYLKIASTYGEYKPSYRNNVYVTPSEFFERHAEWLKTYPTNSSEYYQILEDDCREYKIELKYTTNIEFLRSHALCHQWW